jgi:hypothetical protein
VQTYTITVSGSGANCEDSIAKGGMPHTGDIKLTSGTGSIIEICSQGDSQHYLTCATDPAPAPPSPCHLYYDRLLSAMHVDEIMRASEKAFASAHSRAVCLSSGGWAAWP